MNAAGRGCLWITGIVVAAVVALVTFVVSLAILGNIASEGTGTATAAATEVGGEPKAEAPEAHRNPFRDPVPTTASDREVWFRECRELRGMPDERALLVKLVSTVEGRAVSLEEAVRWLEGRHRQQDLHATCDLTFTNFVMAGVVTGAIDDSDIAMLQELSRSRTP